MDLVQPGKERIKFASSSQSVSQTNKDLLTVRYKRSQRVSPLFSSLFEGIDQSVDVKISTFIFRAAPEPVISLYDFVMTTFVPQQSNNKATESSEDRIIPQQQPTPPSDEKIRVDVELDSVQGRQYLYIFLMRLTHIHSNTRQRHQQPCYTVVIGG
jgi:vacuolar protein sorting-associated protein 13A/C